MDHNIQSFISYCTKYGNDTKHRGKMERCQHNLNEYNNKTYNFKGCPENYGVIKRAELCLNNEYAGMINICKLCWQEALNLE